MTPRIRAIATALPEGRLTRERWTELAVRIAPEGAPAPVIERLAERSGIDGRGCAATPPAGGCFYPGTEGGAPDDPGTAARMALWKDAAWRMAEAAARDALAHAGVAGTAVTHCVTASCTGYESPGIDAHLVERLGLPASCRRLNVGHMGCHAAVNALAAVRDMVLADPRATVLVCCAEVSSAHFQRSLRMDRMVANAIFADGCAAAVVAAGTDGPEVTATHSMLIPGTADEMRWTVGDHGFEMTLGAGVPDILRECVGPWVRASLAEHGLDAAAVGGWAIHPGGPRVLDAVTASLALPPGADAASRAVLREHGNMSSATLLFILRRMAQSAIPRPWVGLAFGPGLVGEMLLLR